MANVYNISAVQGDQLQISLKVRDQNCNPINLSGYDVRGVVKYGYFGSPPALDISGNYISGILLNLNPIVYSGQNGSYLASGVVYVNVSSSSMANMPVGSFVYDIERFPKGNPTGDSIKLLQGKFLVEPEVTTF